MKGGPTPLAPSSPWVPLGSKWPGLRYALEMGVILTIVTKWDDPPSRIQGIPCIYPHLADFNDKF